MLKPPTEPSELLERLKSLLTINNNNKIKSNIRKNWNNNVESLLADSQMQKIAEDLLKLSNNSTKLNMLIVSYKYF